MQNTRERKPECPECEDRLYVPIERDGRRGHVHCACWAGRAVRSRLAVVPARFAGVTLETVRPRPSQRTYLEEMRRVPTANYALTGPPATGKSHLMWALYATVAQDVGRRVVACSLLSLVDQYRSAYGARTEGEVVTAAVHPSDLEQNAQPYSLFLDDVDKPRMTDYVIERVHALFDAAYNYGHQVVVTSNLHPAALTDLYTRHHGHYGAATMRRVLHEGCTVFKFE